MAQSMFEGLRQTLELLKEAEALQDADIRAKMQRLIITAMMEVPSAPAVDGLAQARTAAAAATPAPAIEPPFGYVEQRVVQQPAPGTMRARVLETVAILGSKETPVAAVELEQELPDMVEGGKISKTLSQLWGNGLLRRVQRDEVARDGYTRGTYKYYVPEPD